ncbi:polysaccharide deacetylase family protein [Anaerobacillus sp. CMMVII]|uniref:polysaccharide deacetylase family protein n=1 Tax=Anaerobacillus sp. CMMVII TaxID=2755588 RepID=UPI0021B78C01|nr:polysaccharide deacetylase family protein [Anaerobacillus sp. CMMVII]MCT8137090.1 polysaccharide deacetylase family protein [Anaerobacillus sp. CMMVII]
MARIINEVQTQHKVVAITFDDGPNPLYTSQVLEIFAEVSGKATFYMIGNQMTKYPEIVEAAIEQGHEIGNHTYTHPKLTDLNSSDHVNEIKLSDKITKEMTGQSPTTFRPPYFDYNNETHSICENLGYRMIGACNLDAMDWEQPGVEHILSKSREQIKKGSILIFHDGFGDRSQTIEAVRLLVKELHSQGYKLVTVSELLRLAEERMN